jgi:putative HNHc nuclease
MALPRKLKPPKMGARVVLQTIWPRHRRWVRAHGCCVPDCPAIRVEFAHLRNAANCAMARKPHDAFGVSLCRIHHEEQHRVGMISFSRKYQIDLWALAAEYAQRSPDQAMRASLRLIEPGRDRDTRSR